MLDQEEDLDKEDEDTSPQPLSRKKMLIFLLPVLIVVGLSVGLYYALTKDYQTPQNSYSIIKKGNDANGEESITVFYDLPEFSATMHADGTAKKTLHIRVNLELSSVEDIKTIELLIPKINDIVLTHIIELTPEEIEGSTGLYWLKEELLYRLNLAVSPIKISNLNIKSLELETAKE